MQYYLLCSLSCVRLFATPWTVARQAPLSMGFFRQEYWSGLPFLSPGFLIRYWYIYLFAFHDLCHHVEGIVDLCYSCVHLKMIICSRNPLVILHCQSQGELTSWQQIAIGDDGNGLFIKSIIVYIRKLGNNLLSWSSLSWIS